VSEVRAVVIDGFGDTPHLAAFPLPELTPRQAVTGRTGCAVPGDRGGR
jgi:hypothetical protein